jgi:hypothetical protein
VLILSQEQNRLILDYSTSKIDREGFARKWGVGVEQLREVPRQLLERALIAGGDADDVALALLLAYEEGIDAEYVSVLCRLLDVDWHKKHEDIAFQLGLLRDPRAVDCLYRAALKRLDYLAYDDSFVLASKSIFALGFLADDGSSAAVEKLELLAQSENEVIREYATEQLDGLASGKPPPPVE